MKIQFKKSISHNSRIIMITVASTCFKVLKLYTKYSAGLWYESWYQMMTFDHILRSVPKSVKF